MNVTGTIKDWKRNQRDQSQILKQRISIVQERADILEKLPDALSYSRLNTYESEVVLEAFLSSDEEVKKLIAEIREVLSVKESTKEFNGTSNVNYITKCKGIVTIVHGGDLPEGCKLIPESHSYITFTMECKDE